MKGGLAVRGRKIVASLLAVGVAFFAFAGLASAQSFRSGENVVIGGQETVNGALYAAGNSVTVSGRVVGDVFCAGQNITIDARVEGDVICAGQNVKVGGTVSGDIRLAGQTINVDGKVSGSATVAAQSLTISSGGSIARDLTGGVQNLTLTGSIGRDLTIGAEQATLNGEVGRNVTSEINRLSLGSQAVIGGNLTYTSSSDANVARQAQISGQTARLEPKVEEEQKEFAGAVFAGVLYFLTAMLLIALVLILVLPRLMHSVTENAVKKPGWTALVGFLSLVIVPVVIVLSFMTIIGIPLGILLSLAWVLILLLTGPVAAYYLGRVVFADKQHPVFMMLVGAILLWILYLVPVLGLLVMFLVGIFGTGMIVSELLGRYPRPSYAEVTAVSDKPAATKSNGAKAVRGKGKATTNRK